MWKIRAITQYDLTSQRKLLLDAGFAGGFGTFSTDVGQLDSKLEVQTLRLAYLSDSFRSHVYWSYMPAETTGRVPLVLGGLELTLIKSAQMDFHSVDFDF